MLFVEVFKLHFLLATNLGTGSHTWPAALEWENETEPTWTVSGDDLVTFTKIGSTWIGGALLNVGVPA